MLNPTYYPDCSGGRERCSLDARAEARADQFHGVGGCRAALDGFLGLVVRSVRGGGVHESGESAAETGGVAVGDESTSPSAAE